MTVKKMKLLSKKISASGRISPHEVMDDERYGLSVCPENECVLEGISATFAFKFEKTDMLFQNGYQSWTFSPERGVRECDTSLKYCPGFINRAYGFSRYGDRYFYAPKYKKGVLHGYSYAYVRRGDRYFLFASLAEKSGFTRFIFDTNRNEVRIEKDCEGRTISAEYRVFDVIFIEGTQDEVFDRYFEMLGIAALSKKCATGYTSWYNCYQDISQTRIESDLEGLKCLPIKPDIFQIDDGFETYVGDWLECDKTKFPCGTKPIAEKITAQGYCAGIWLAPFVCEKNSALYREHPDYLLRDENGKPIYCGSNWSGAYALDFYNKSVREYIRKSIEKYKSEGFTLFKLDFLYAACMRHRPDKTRGEIMDEVMAFLREICGDAQIIGCGVPLASAFGRVEYCRIGPDVSLDYDDKAYMRLFHAERPSTKHTMMNTLFRRQLSGRAFLNDTDVFILRDDNTSLTPLQKKALGTLNGLFGGLLFASDEFGKYDRAKKDMYLYFTKLKDAKNIQITKQKNRLCVTYELENKTQKLEYDF